MRAGTLGEHLLMQAISTWNEREIEYTTTTAGIYWLANILRSNKLKDRNIELAGDTATLWQIAEAIDKVSRKHIPKDFISMVDSGIKVLRARGSNEILEIDLKRTYPRQRFPDPLQ